jgi:glycosyltransferase involved in cell wall biosynthesis
MDIIFDVRPLMGGKHSGVETYTRNLLKHLLLIDKKNRYLLFANSSSDQSANIPAIDLPNVYTLQTRIPNKILNFSLLFINRPRIDRLIAKHFPGFKPELYFTPDLRPISLNKHIKKICVVHDLSYHHYPKNFSRKTRLWHKLLNAKKTLRGFDRIIAVSAFTKNDLIKTFESKPEIISVTHEGIEEDFCTAMSNGKTAEIRTKYSLPNNYLLFLSTLEPRKNLLRLIEAFNIYKNKHRNDLKLVFVGTTNPKIFSSLHVKTQEDMVFTGFVKEEDKPYLFQMAKAFLYPSLLEGFGLPLLEAMKCGTPIITSNISSMPEICDDAALYVIPTDIPGIADAIEKILDPITAERLKTRMLKRIKDFSWDKCARQTLDLIESI